MLEMPILESERLTVRPFTRDDLPAIHPILRDCFPSDEPEHETLAHRREWLEWTVRNYIQLARLYQPPYGERAICRKTDGKLIGAVGLVPCLTPFGQLPGFYPKSPVKPGQATAEVGLFWAVAPEHQGNGYATEAANAVIRYTFDTLHLARIIATTEYDNAASQKVMEKLGMRLLRNPLPDPPYLQVVGVLDQRADNHNL